jgi:hypothetical protein
MHVVSTTTAVVSHGGRLLFGSDTPSDDTYANPPGCNGYLELRELEKAGISPRQILDAATRVNAEFFHPTGEHVGVRHHRARHRRRARRAASRARRALAIRSSRSDVFAGGASSASACAR